MFYNRFRYYEPTVGQYCCADPIGFWGGLRSQSYVFAPTHWIDPNGLDPVNLDTSALRGLFSPDASTRDAIMNAIGGRQAVVTQTAMDEFTSALQRMQDKGYITPERAKEMLEQVNEIANIIPTKNCCLSTKGLTNKNQINDRDILGTAKGQNMPTITADQGMINIASQEGASIIQVPPTGSIR